MADVRLKVVLGVLSAFGPLSIAMYLPSLPAIRASLQASTASVQLTLASFMAGIGIGHIVYGPAVFDRLGRRGPLFCGGRLVRRGVARPRHGEQRRWRSQQARR